MARTFEEILKDEHASLAHELSLLVNEYSKKQAQIEFIEMVFKLFNEQGDTRKDEMVDGTD